MATRTLVAILTQEDSGSLMYSDVDDGVVFYIESQSPGDALSQAEENEQLTELSKHFLRQHLIKNGVRSHELIPLMRDSSAAPLLAEVVKLHLQTIQRFEDALSTLYATLGNLVSVMHYRQQAIRIKEEKLQKRNEEDQSIESQPSQT